MRIRLVVISLDDLTRFRPLVDALRSAVNSGDMDCVDAVTNKLMDLTSAEHSIDLSEEEWGRFLAEIRIKDPAFHSDYLLPSEVCSPLLSNLASETMVLQFPFD